MDTGPLVVHSGSIEVFRLFKFVSKFDGADLRGFRKIGSSRSSLGLRKFFT